MGALTRLLAIVFLGLSLSACGEGVIEGEVGKPRTPGAPSGSEGVIEGEEPRTPGVPSGSSGPMLPPPTAWKADCPDPSLVEAPTVTYVCDCQSGADVNCQAGSDGASGSSPNTPKQTYGAARSAFGGLPAGGAVAFCRGGSFAITGSRNWVNTTCLAGTPCIIRDYEPPWASGDEDRPLLSATSSGAFYFQASGHDEGVQILNLNLQGGGGGDALFFYDDISDVLLCNLTMEGFDKGLHSASLSNARIELRNSFVLNNAGQGWLGSCNDCGVRGTLFQNNGFDEAMLNHNIYFSGGDGMYAIGNDLYQSTMVSGECRGVSFVVHGNVNGLLIEGNTVREDIGAAASTCWGISVDPGYPSAETFENVTIRGNQVINVGNVSIGLAGCRNCTIENNVVIQENGGGTAITNNVRSLGSGDSTATANIIRNNSLFASQASGSTGISVGGDGSNHISVNNSIHYSGTGSYDCFSYDLSNSAYDARDNNLCYGPSAGDLDFANSQSLSAWQSASGDDANSIDDQDPLYTSVTSPYDLAPQSGFPLIDAGNVANASSVDVDGNVRDAQPDIGAYELR